MECPVGRRVRHPAATWAGGGRGDGQGAAGPIRLGPGPDGLSAYGVLRWRLSPAARPQSVARRSFVPSSPATPNAIATKTKPRNHVMVASLVRLIRN